MTGAGGNIGGGACSRSITDFATSAAERMPGTSARAFAGRRALSFFAGLFGGPFGGFFGRLLAEPRGALFVVVLAGLIGVLRAALTVFGGGELRTAGMSLSVAAGRRSRVTAEVAAASALRCACFAAFFSTLNNLRACFSCAFAARIWTFAAAARAAALVAATLSRLMNCDELVIQGSTRIRN
jgi:hypothetical protein